MYKCNTIFLTTHLVIGPQTLSLSDNLTLNVVCDKFQYQATRLNDLSQSNKAMNRWNHKLIYFDMIDWKDYQLFLFD